jgi:hypothetical protein
MKGLRKNLSGISLAFLLSTGFTSLQSEADDLDNTNSDYEENSSNSSFSPLSKFRAFKSRLSKKINNSSVNSTTSNNYSREDSYSGNTKNYYSNNNRSQNSRKVIIEPEMSQMRKPVQIEAQIDQMILAKWRKPDSVDQYSWERILIGVKQASKTTGIPQQLIMSLINKESAFKSAAISKTGAIGLMQLMPSTAASECHISNANDLYDIELNIKCGTSYLDKQIKYFKRVDLALAAYNAGPGAVRRAVDKAQTDNIEIVTSLLKPETAPYVRKILANINYGDDFL